MQQYVFDLHAFETLLHKNNKWPEGNSKKITQTLTSFYDILCLNEKYRS